MTHTHAKGQGQRSLGSRVRVETDGRTDGCDGITSRANVVGKSRYDKNVQFYVGIKKRRWRILYLSIFLCVVLLLFTHV